MAGSELACIYATLILHDEDIAITVRNTHHKHKVAGFFFPKVLRRKLMFFLEIIMQSDKIATLVKSANVNVESYWPSLFAKLAEKRNVGDLIMNIGAGGGAAAPIAVSSSAPAAASAAAPAVEEKKVKLMVHFFLVSKS